MRKRLCILTLWFYPGTWVMGRSPGSASSWRACGFVLGTSCSPAAPRQPMLRGQGDPAGDGTVVPKGAAQPELREDGLAQGAPGVTGQHPPLPGVTAGPRGWGEKEQKQFPQKQRLVGVSPFWGGSSRWERHSGLQGAADIFI